MLNVIQEFLDVMLFSMLLGRSKFLGLQKYGITWAVLLLFWGDEEMLFGLLLTFFIVNVLHQLSAAVLI